MNRLDAPKLDNRSAQDIFEEVEGHVRQRLSVNARRDDRMAEALLRVFARYCEVIIQRLNRVPEKTYRVFLDTLDLSRLPPLPARVPLTFSLVKKLPEGAGTVIVPARTKVAGAPAPGGDAPVVFETTREIALTDITLEKVAALDPHSDRWSDKSVLASREGGGGEFVFLARTPVVHEFYLRHDAIFGIPGISRLRIRLDVSDGAGPARGPLDVEWRIPAPKGDIVLTPLQDSTSGFTQAGDVVFAPPAEWPEHEPFGRPGRWLACQLRQPLPVDHGARDATRRSDRPTIRAVAVSARWQLEESPVSAAYATAGALDLTRDFYPFGDHPRFNDVFYVASDAFGNPGSSVALNVRLTNPASGLGNPSLPRVTKAGQPVVKWEYWDGRHWADLVVRDETGALTENGQVSFTVPASMRIGSVNGEERFWVRARLVGGDYGLDERLEFSETGSFRRIPSTLAPPSIQAISVSSVLSAGPSAPEMIVTHNNLVLDEVAIGRDFAPFQQARESRPALYLGFRFPGDGMTDARWDAALAGRPIDLYCHVRVPPTGPAYLTDAAGRGPRLTWQYWNGREWLDATVSDTTAALTVPGVVTIRAGKDAMPWLQTTLGRDLYWVRVLWSGGEFGGSPEMTRMALNTVMATQTLTLENELLGSSNGKPGQTFHTARTPVLAEFHLEVREGEAADGEAWVPWQEVDSWSSSTHDDRHFVVNRETGEITFGDNVHGRVPPRGTNNVRLPRYQTGGGAGGNRPPGTIGQLRTTVPYVDAAVNLEAAVGGQDAEDWESLAERGSRSLRHRDRAVTAEDYEDLAKLASPRVALAKCYGCEDAAGDSFDGTLRPGTVSVVVVPRDPEARPRPSLELLRRVRDFLDERSAPEVSLVVLAPRYVRVCVEADVVAREVSGGGGVQVRCEARLAQFLHPVTGGEQGRGWRIGDVPHESDLYAQLEDVDGVGYVRSLRFRLEEEEPRTLETQRFVISSGEHRIQLES
ncbi:MAG TPA: putative baseplate assembly protein [Candidatus Acidoferrum sp.]|nr:putative baseplate assembly protein [Candidatus Acidoferrum sp.]